MEFQSYKALQPTLKRYAFWGRLSASVRAMKMDSPLSTFIGYEVSYFTDTDLID
jgi:hypothetical protein